MLTVKLPDLNATREFARKLALMALAGDVITLRGDLGAGKSELARAFIKALAGESTVVPSPTFTILEQYETPKGLISHLDLYRIEGPEELVELGFEEVLAGGITLIEWPERLGEYRLSHVLALELTADPLTEERTIILVGDPSWTSRLGFFSV